VTTLSRGLHFFWLGILYSTGSVCRVCSIWHRAPPFCITSKPEGATERIFLKRMEIASVAARARSRVPGVPQSNCVYPFVTLRGGYNNRSNTNKSSCYVYVKWYEPKSHAVLSPLPRLNQRVANVVRFFFIITIQRKYNNSECFIFKQLTLQKIVMIS
jgi:hypothetical protein